MPTTQGSSVKIRSTTDLKWNRPTFHLKQLRPQVSTSREMWATTGAEGCFCLQDRVPTQIGPIMNSAKFATTS